MADESEHTRSALLMDASAFDKQTCKHVMNQLNGEKPQSTARKAEEPPQNFSEIMELLMFMILANKTTSTGNHT
jgi:hypothetical protein